MSVMTEDVHAAAPSVFYDPRVRKIVFQIVLAVVVVFLIVAAASNAVERLHQQNTAMGFEFLHRPAGFDISQTPIEFTSKGSTNLEAFVVGLLNTLIVGSIGVVVATILGFTIGIARLSPNWLISKIATVYVEFIRNIPLLLQLYFWYSAVLKPLPNPRQSVSVGDTVFLNNRGVYMPAIDLGGSGLAMLIGLLLGLAGAFGYARYGRRVQEATGRRPPVGLVSAGIIIGVSAHFPRHRRDGEHQHAAAPGFQLHRWIQGRARIRCADPRTQPVYGFLHRRDRARRHSCGVAWPDGGGKGVLLLDRTHCSPSVPQLTLL